MIAGKKIVIVGAGMAGLTCAIALQQKALENGVEPPHVVIVERDAGPEAKDRQDYTISIRSDVGGSQALNEIGVLDSIRPMASPTEGLFIATHNARRWLPALVLKRPPASVSADLRVPRVGLWKVLLEKALSYDLVSLRWSTIAVDVQLLDPSSNDGSVIDRNDPVAVARLKDVPCKMRISLDDGSSIDDADLVIVADGCRSRLREAFFGDAEKPNFLKTMGIAGEAKFDLSQDTIPHAIKDQFGLVMSKGCSVFVAQENVDTFIWCVAFPSAVPHDRREIVQDDISQDAGQILLQQALAYGKIIPEPFTTLVNHSFPDKMRIINFYDKFPHRNSLDGRVIYIGDSTHPVSPYSGSGANMAIVDGLSLSRFLCNPSFSRLSDAATAFDNEMIPRCSSRVKMQRTMLWVAHDCKNFFSLTTRNFLLHTSGFLLRHPVVFVGLSLASLTAFSSAVAFAYLHFKLF